MAAGTTIDTGNSSTALLAAGEVFVGEATNVVRWGSVTVFASSDVGTVREQGLILQCSTDGVNWDKDIFHTVEPGVAFVTGIDVSAQFFRVQYRNGSHDQGEFRLQVLLHPNTMASTIGGDPSSYVPVRVTNGDSFDDGVELLSVQYQQLEQAIAMRSLLEINNLYLSRILGETLTEEDLDHGED